MRVLFVGDVHAKVEDLEDCDLLRSHIFGTVQKHEPSWVVFLGDQYDTHALKNVQVERFWMYTFAQLREAGPRIFALVGNHDRPGSAAIKAHSMQVHGEHVTVVDRPMAEGRFLFLPYYHDPKQLVDDAKLFPKTSFLVCHAAFEGGHYDNGVPIKADAFYGKDVVNPNDLPQGVVISGHIHAGAKFGKVWYPGSPRWQTMGDANRSRAIYVVDFFDDGGMRFVDEVSTNDILRRTWQFDYTPADEAPALFALVGPKDRVLVNIRGPVAFCEESKKLFQAKGYRVKAFPTDRGAVKVAESEGIPKAFEKHFAGFKPKHGTPLPILRGMFHERLHV